MSRSHTHEDPRQRLAALQEVLRSFGAVVRQDDVDRLPNDVVEALCGYETRRIRALAEGTAAGWTPGWRQDLGREHSDRDRDIDGVAAVCEAIADPSAETGKTQRPEQTADPAEMPAVPIRLHRSHWRATA